MFLAAKPAHAKEFLVNQADADLTDGVCDTNLDAVSRVSCSAT
jgi:hypothetical protein